MPSPRRRKRQATAASQAGSARARFNLPASPRQGDDGLQSGAGHRSSEAPSPATPPETGPERNATADGLALNIFRQLVDESLADQWAVLNEVRAVVVGAASERVVASLNAMRVCQADEGRLAKNVFDKWRFRQPVAGEWPSSQFIIDTFGSWAKAMAAAGAGVVVDVLVSEMTTDTGPFSEAEVVACLREYAESGRPLTFKAYREWSRDRMGDPARKLPRYIRSMRRINEMFGTWAGALAAAGLSERAAADGRGPTTRRGTAEDYAPDNCVRWVKTAGVTCGGGKMTTAAYNEFAGEQERVAARERRDLTVPRADAVRRTLGSWARALHLAGFISEEQALMREGQRTTFTPDEELLQALELAVARYGAEVTDKQYDELRKRRRLAGEGVLASSKLIAKRFGGWEAAVQRCLFSLLVQSGARTRARVADLPSERRAGDRRPAAVLDKREAA